MKKLIQFLSLLLLSFSCTIIKTEIDCQACCSGETRNVSAGCCQQCNYCMGYSNEGKVECYDIPAGGSGEDD